MDNVTFVKKHSFNGKDPEQDSFVFKEQYFNKLNESFPQTQYQISFSNASCFKYKQVHYYVLSKKFVDSLPF
jgi:hypothetical protein